MLVNEYLEKASALTPPCYVSIRGLLYNRPAPEGAFVTDMSNVTRYRGGRQDEVKDISKIIRLDSVGLPAPAPRSFRPDYIGSWFGDLCQIEGTLMTSGLIRVHAITEPSKEWANWYNARESAPWLIDMYTRSLERCGSDEDNEGLQRMRIFYEEKLAEAHTDLTAPEPDFAAVTVS